MENSNLLLTHDQFKELKIKEKVYQIVSDDVKSLFFAGMNPMSENLAMFVDSADHKNIINIYIPRLGLPHSLIKLVKDYDEAKNIMLENAINNVETIKKIYFNQ